MARSRKTSAQPGSGKKQNGTPYITVSSSRLDAFSRCRRYAYWRYLCCLEPKTTNWAFVAGELVHSALECLYNTGDYEEALQLVRKRLKMIGPDLRNVPRGEEEYAKMSAMVLGMIPAYDKFYEDDWDKWHIVATEVGFNDLQVTPDVAINGRMDLVLQSPKNGKYVVMEHKTRSRVTGNVRQALHLKTQAILYTLACSQLFDVEVDTVVYNLIRKPQLRQKKQENYAAFLQRIRGDYDMRPAKYFFREPVRINRERRDSLTASLMSLARDFRSCMDAEGSLDEVWRKEPAMCDVYGGCEFFQLCLRGASKAALLHFRTSDEIRGCENGPSTKWQGRLV